MKYILAHTFLLVISIFVFAQPPQAINYQGIARDAQGHPLINQSISIRLSILDLSATGSAIYVETQNVNTNNSGLFNLGIGLGTVVSGTFTTIPWWQGDKWLQVELDASVGSNYQLVGSTQFLTVPFAFYSQTAGSVTSLPLTIQERLDAGETPKHIYDSGVPKEFLIGKLYAGGVIFYFNTGSGTGLVAATVDQSISATWNNGNYLTTSATGIAIGTGQTNTSLIVATQGIGNYAAYLCDTLNLNGYSDWFLPSYNEIIEMDNIINPPYFAVYQLWSSTEYDFVQSWFLFDNNGMNNRPKTNLYGVHAARAF